MPHFLFFADTPEKRRPDGLNAVLVEGADQAAAETAIAGLMKDGNGAEFDNFAVVEITDTSGVMVAFQGEGALGQPGNSLGIPTISRGGGVPLNAE